MINVDSLIGFSWCIECFYVYLINLFRLPPIHVVALVGLTIRVDVITQSRNVGLTSHLTDQ